MNPEQQAKSKNRAQPPDSEGGPDSAQGGYAPSVPEYVLRLLREWGLETGFEKLNARIESTVDPLEKSSLQLLAGWLAGERGAADQATRQFQSAGQLPQAQGWALVGVAFVKSRSGQFAQAQQLLDQAEKIDRDFGPEFRGAIHHCRGVIAVHQAETTAALEHLNSALECFGKDHFAVGRILDSMGMVYATCDKLQVAREFYEAAIERKNAHNDLLGVALTHGQLGRVFLDWGELDQAEHHFRRDLEISERLSDERSIAQMYNHLGQTFLQLGQFEKAADYLDESIRRSESNKFHIVEAFARKDRASVHLQLEQYPQAIQQLDQSDTLFRVQEYSLGMAHTRQTRAIVQSQLGNFDESEKLAAESARYFDEHGIRPEAARAWLKIAKIRRFAKVSKALVVDALIAALERAELSGRDVLIREIEDELRHVDPREHLRHAYNRARGRDIREDTTSLRKATAEVASVLFLDLKNFTEFVRIQDPGNVMETINQIFAELAAVLERHQIVVNQYLGDGFMALIRGTNHAERAVRAALDLVHDLERFNRPRRILGLREMSARIGISSGAVVFGNVGTHRKIDFTAIGPTTNLAARLQSEARPIAISGGTYDFVREHFHFSTDSPRLLTLKGLGDHQVYDVVGERIPQ